MKSKNAFLNSSRSPREFNLIFFICPKEVKFQAWTQEDRSEFQWPDPIRSPESSPPGPVRIPPSGVRPGPESVVRSAESDLVQSPHYGMRPGPESPVWNKAWSDDYLLAQRERNHQTKKRTRTKTALSGQFHRYRIFFMNWRRNKSLYGVKK